MNLSHKYSFALDYAVVLAVMLLIPSQLKAQDPPDIPDLIRVTVDHSDNGVLIQWEPSMDTDIEFYHLYKMNAQQSFELLFTFDPYTFEYKHMTSGLKNLAYAVTAEDSTGNESLFGQNVHRAVSVSSDFDLCELSNEVQWTGYEGWEGIISGYKLYGAIAGAPFLLLEVSQNPPYSFTHSQVEVDTTYVYYVETTNNKGITSISSIDSVTSIFPEAPSYITVDYVSVIDESTIELQFSADINGPVTSFRIMRRGNPATPFTAVTTLWNVGQTTSVVQDQFLTASTSYQYMVQSLFQPVACNSPLVISESNTGNSILLENELEERLLTLNWTDYEEYETGLAGYTIQRRGSDGEFIDIETVGPNTTQWQETIESVINGFQPGEIQYRVLALNNDGGNGEPGISMSNITSVTVETEIKVPNAFTPGNPGSSGVDHEFKPLMDFGPKEYLMLVVDRGGRKLFETTQADLGWDGRFQNGEFVNEGVYVYYIQYTDYTGLTRSLTGNVTVVYP
jgi:hypothetical protein